MVMSSRETVDPFSRPFARRLCAMIEAELVTFREFIPWADATIRQLESPPYWILNLAITRYKPEALKIVREFGYAEYFEANASRIEADEYVASAYLRYERREISWASFLRLSGHMADGCQGGAFSCEFYYELLNKFEDAHFALFVEEQQKSELVPQLAEIIESVRRTFQEFRE